MTKLSLTKNASEKFVYDVVFSSEIRIEKKLDSIESKMEDRFNKVMTSLDKLAGLFKKVDEERIILSAHSKNHTDRVEKLEKKVFKAVQI